MQAVRSEGKGASRPLKKRRQWNGFPVQRRSCSPGLLFALLCSEQFWQPGEIVAGHREGELRTDALGAAEHGPGERADGLAPAEDLLDPLADALAYRIALMSGRATIDG